MKRYIAMIKRDWKKGKVLDCIIFIGAPLVVLLALILIGVWILVRIAQILSGNIDTILGFGLTVILAVIYFKNSSKIKAAIDKQTTCISEEAEDSKSQSLMINYQIIGRIIFQIARQYYALLKVRKPECQQDVESSSRIQCQGKIIFYEYILYKTANYDVANIKLLIEQFIENKLKSEGLEGISQQYYLWEGVTMPILKLHKIEDCLGYYKIHIVIVNKHYCEFLSNKINTNLVSTVESIYDEDF